VVRRLAFAVPGDLATPTGGYAYDRRMIAELAKLGWQVDVVGLGEGFPHPDAQQAQGAAALLSAIPAGRIVVIDGLAFGVLPEVAVALQSRNPVVALVHHPLALEAGLSPQQAEALRISERRALAAARGIIVTSAATARILIADYGVPENRITVAQPGNDPAPRAPGNRSGPVQLLAVGAVVPRKGYDVLIAGLAPLRGMAWRLTIAGDRRRDPQTAAGLDGEIARHKLGGHVSVLGAVSGDHLAALYADADAFVLASHFEGYGMAYAEALAHGLPLIGTTGGAIPNTVPADAAILVAPGDIAALTAALRAVIESPQQRLRMAEAARQAAQRLMSWRQSAEIFSRALEALA
jgi:glycosyltransferase involved in cell wall biosynthesis